MRRQSVIIFAGFVMALAAFAFFYFAGTAGSRELLRDPNPELAWLKKEFKLPEAEFQRIASLHESYLPKCAERCQLIDEQNTRLKELLSQHAGMTPEIEQVMQRRAAIRAECEAEMMRHFVEVSRTMRPEQGRRYLQWIEQQTILRGEAMERRHHTSDEGDETEQRGHQH